nr:hypothetical protein [Pirellulaceae bacterium]
MQQTMNAAMLAVIMVFYADIVCGVVMRFNFYRKVCYLSCLAIISLVLGLSNVLVAQDKLAALVRVVDLSVGESVQVELCNGEHVQVKLLDLQETRDPIRQAIRSAIVEVQVDGEVIKLESGMYNLPQALGKVQIDCSVTGGYNSNGTPGY